MAAFGSAQVFRRLKTRVWKLYLTAALPENAGTQWILPSNHISTTLQFVARETIEPRFGMQCKKCHVDGKKGRWMLLYDQN
jgi:hypothetical protein